MNKKEFKQSLLNELYAPYKKCLSCPLGFQGRTKVVFGEGNPDADLMFIGEGPGQEEDTQGKPFVGRSGMLLNRIFNTLNIKREEIFITNIVKCRPPNNRKPLPTESKTCRSILLEQQLKIIQPRVICTLGAAALEGLLEQEVKITQLRGKSLEWNSITIIPAFHPAYVLRNPAALDHLIADIKKSAHSAGIL